MYRTCRTWLCLPTTGAVRVQLYSSSKVASSTGRSAGWMAGCGESRRPKRLRAWKANRNAYWTQYNLIRARPVFIALFECVARAMKMQNAQERPTAVRNGDALMLFVPK